MELKVVVEGRSRYNVDPSVDQTGSNIAPLCTTSCWLAGPATRAAADVIKMQ